MKTSKNKMISLFFLALFLGMTFFSNLTYALNTDQQRGNLIPWSDMDNDAKTDFLEKMNIELSDDWDDMTDDEQDVYIQEYMEDNRPEDGGMGRNENMELPDNRTEMTEEEASIQEYMKENRSAKGIINFTKNAVKAANYVKFTGELLSKKDFNDDDDIENLEAVTYLQQRGILSGYDDGSFGPQNSINRAESLKVLLESLGEEIDDIIEEDFSDVSVNDWFAGYVSTAKNLGIINGYEDGTFRPGQTVNQAELLKLAFESFGMDLSSYQITELPEGIDTSAWYAVYLQYAIDNGVLDLVDVNPSEGMTRDSFAELIYRLIQQQENL